MNKYTGAKRQYLLAIVAGLALLTYQLWRIAGHIRPDWAAPKTQMMRHELETTAATHPAAVAVVASYLMFALIAHLLLTIGSVAVFRTTMGRISPRIRDRVWPCFGFQLLSILVAIFWNRHFYPMSRAFPDSEVLLIQPLSGALLWGTTLTIGAASLIAIYVWVSKFHKTTLGLALLVTAAYGLPACKQLISSDSDGRRANKSPDIIILGVDSMRPDFMRTYGFPREGLTPSIDSTLDETVVFDDAITPLARTFVSYMSLLRGQNPITHGARFNLYPRSKFSQKQTLAWRLRDADYFSVMAMDESRFANFDSSFGFNKIITPPANSLDFLISSSYDLVATNLLMLIPSVGQSLRYLHGNRAAYGVYRPNDFPQQVIAALRDAPADKPLFLINHFCLPHWPYQPFNVLAEDDYDYDIRADGFHDAPKAYMRALHTADSQFRQIIDELRRLGRLQNAVLVVMSDHGEGFEMRKDEVRQEVSGNFQQTVAALGHGSLALSKVQHHIVLGMQRYSNGKAQWGIRHVAGPASLIDVAPTISETVGISLGSFEGRSMYGTLNSGERVLPDQLRFVENGIRSDGVERPVIDEHAVAQEMAYLYSISPDLRFEIQPKFLAAKISEKQRGVLWKDLGVMVDPHRLGSNPKDACWKLVNYTTKTMTCIDFPASTSDARKMQQAVCRYFDRDRGFREQWCTIGRGTNN